MSLIRVANLKMIASFTKAYDVVIMQTLLDGRDIAIMKGIFQYCIFIFIPSNNNSFTQHEKDNCQIDCTFALISFYECCR